MLHIEFHSSAAAETLKDQLAEGLQRARLDAKFLYLTDRQAELWEKVAACHSPVHTRPDFRRVFHDAFRAVAEKWPGTEVHLVGLGSGTGAKEAQLCGELRARGKSVRYVGVDASAHLVTAAALALTTEGARVEESLICDLTCLAKVQSWLDEKTDGAPRLFTLFGVVPAFTPTETATLLVTLLRPGDALLASVHLAAGTDPSALTDLLPQYDNPETLAWLAAARDELGLRSTYGPVSIRQGWIENTPAFLGVCDNVAGSSGPSQGPLVLFQSLRYTQESFARLVQQRGLRGVLLSETSCGEEGIWSVSC